MAIGRAAEPVVTAEVPVEATTGCGPLAEPVAGLGAGFAGFAGFASCVAFAGAAPAPRFVAACVGEAAAGGTAGNAAGVAVTVWFGTAAASAPPAAATGTGARPDTGAGADGVGTAGVFSFTAPSSPGAPVLGAGSGSGATGSFSAALAAALPCRAGSTFRKWSTSLKKRS
ncbi:hypothetical protein GAS18_04510 [Burkholderia glumae]|nr:hypothetical protein GAS18_04510 [Burkholderia glumae]